MKINSLWPPAIRHLDKPRIRHEEREQMVKDAAQHVRLSKKAARLLWLYADMKDGFRPALKYVENQTGIASNKVSDIRRELCNHGLIQYRITTIYVLWEHIRLFAMMPALKKVEALRAENFEAKRFRKEENLANRFGAIRPAKVFGEPFDRFCLMINEMTESEYFALLRAFPEFKNGVYNLYIGPEFLENDEDENWCYG